MSVRGIAPPRARASVPMLVGIAMAALALAAAAGAIALSGTKTGFVLALVAVLGPLALYWALVRPLVFPFTIFVALVPFDNLLGFSSAGTVTKLLAITSGAAVVVWLLRSRRYIVPDRSILGWTALVFLMLVSLLWALDTQAPLPLLATWCELFALYVATTFLPVDERSLRTVVVVVLLSGVLASLYGSYVFHSGVDVSTNGRLFLSNDETTIDPNHFAAALIMPFALALAALGSTRSTLVRVGAAIVIAVLALGLAIAGSRGALLACAAVFIYLCIRSRQRLLIGILGLAGATLGLAFHGDALMRFSSATSSGGAGRADIWRVGLQAFRDHWLLGAGFGNFPIAYDQAFLRVSEHYYTSWHRAPHNILIGTMVELGVVGGLLLCAAWWLQFRALRIVAPTDRLYSLRIGLEAGMLGLFVSGLFLDIMIRKYLWLAFILVALTRNAVLSRTRTPSRPLTTTWRVSR